MLKKRLIPKLQMKLCRIGNEEQMVLVTTRNFSNYSEIGDPVSQAKIYESQAADELIFVDIDSSSHERDSVIKIIKNVAAEIFMPITVGGGVKSVSDFRELLNSGADKVCVNTAALENPGLIQEASHVFGAQCVVVSIDYSLKNGRYEVFSHSGTRSTGYDPSQWAQEAERLGAGEILLTSIDRDGTCLGLDIEMTQKVAENISIPLITSGGCGVAAHFVEGFLKGKVDAVSAGTYFCFRDQNPMQTRAHIRNADIPIRLHG